MSIKIGIDYTAAVHQSAGIGRYTREMVQALAAEPTFSPHYYLFAAAAREGSLPPLPGENFTWRPTRLTERWLARLWYRLQLPLPVETWTGSLHLLHAPDFILPPVRRTTRTIVTIHDLSFVREPDSIMPGMSDHLNTWVPRSVAQADCVIAVSEATCRDLVELYQTPPEKIRILYHGVTANFKPVTDPARLQAIRQKYRLGQKPLVLSIGTIQPRKNYQRLIQAFAQVKREAALVIAGGAGWKNESIFAEVEKQQMADRVYFPGFVEDTDLPALYSTAAVFVYPSLYEGFGLPILEAMACGVPVIASNRSSLPEVTGDAGLLVDPHDVAAIATAMTRLLEDYPLRQQLSAAGLKRAAQFTWSGMAAQLVDIYRQLLQKE
jgi:glycosyltransferase involved in cell wall biosynthesis